MSAYDCVCVCVFVRVCVCLGFSVSVCLCISVSVSVCLCLSLCLNACVYLCVRVSLHVCLCVHTSMHQVTVCEALLRGVSLTEQDLWEGPRSGRPEQQSSQVSPSVWPLPGTGSRLTPEHPTATSPVTLPLLVAPAGCSRHCL